jgi:SecD/SecF fusion protein
VNRATVVRAVLAFTVLAVSIFYVLTKPPRLGLDLRGGTQIVLTPGGTIKEQPHGSSG